MPQPPRPEAPRDVVVRLERRRGERRGSSGDALYSREVLDVLRVCGAPLRAGDAAPGSTHAPVERRRGGKGDEPI
jgi:hypothetical protein